MQSLISQITNLFATQSLNSLENSGLSTNSSVSTGFGSLLDGFSTEDYTANIATLNGNPLQATHTPISFQLTQFALTAQAGVAEGAIEYSGQIAHARVDGDLFDLTDTRVNPNLNDQDRGAYASLFNASQHTNLASLHNDVSVNSQQTASSLITDSISSNVNPTAAALNHPANVAVVNSQLTSQSQQVNTQTESLVNSRASLQGNVNTSTQENVLQNNANFVTNAKNLTADTNGNLYSNTVIPKEGLTNNANLTNSLEQAMSAYSISSVDEKLVKNSASLNTLPVDNKVSVVNDINNAAESKIPLLKDNLVDPAVMFNTKSETRPALTDTNKINHPILNTQVAITEEAVVEELPVDKLEVVATKQTYNPLQQDEIKRFDNNARDESNNIRSNFLDQHAFSDGNNRAINRNEIGIDLTSTVKNQDIIQDVKFAPNNISVDKANLHNPAAPEPLSVNNKVTGLDRPPLQLDASNQIDNGDDLAQQIAWAKNTNTNNIKIAISPEHLGALEINIENDTDGLNIQFVTQSATAKDALETFMPRLKDMLEQNGLNLQNANVSQQDKGQSDNSGYSDSDQFISQTDNDEKLTANIATKSSETVVSSNNRLLEAFA